MDTRKIAEAKEYGPSSNEKLLLAIEMKNLVSQDIDIVLSKDHVDGDRELILARLYAVKALACQKIKELANQ